MSDIKKILASRKGWNNLMIPCDRFFRELRNKEFLDSPEGITRVPNFTIRPSTSLIDAVFILNMVLILDGQNCGH